VTTDRPACLVNLLTYLFGYQTGVAWRWWQTTVRCHWCLV